MTGEGSQPNALDISVEDLKVLQDNNETLERARMIASEQSLGAAGKKFFLRDGVLYRRYQPPGQIVRPKR